MKYKVGQKVRIKPLEWFVQHGKNIDPIYCGKQAIIKDIKKGWYSLDISNGKIHSNCVCFDTVGIYKDFVYQLEEKDLLGEIKDFPIEVVQRMIDHQVEQGNYPDVAIFQKRKKSCERGAGFDWNRTIEGTDFWRNVIEFKHFDVFFQKYPKQKQLTIEKDMETNKLILNGITLPKGTEAKVSVEEGATIITFQKQEEVKNPKFKKGDFIHSTTKDGDYWISIFDRIENGMVYTYADFGLEDGNIHGCEENPRFSDIKKLAYIRLCTEPEKGTMLNELAAQRNLKWNAEELKFEPIRWRAGKGGKFWFITSNGVIDYAIDNYKPTDNLYFNLRNYFETPGIANKALPLWKEFFKNLSL